MAQIQPLRPGGPVLQMQLPVGLGNGVDLQEASVTPLDRCARPKLLQALPICAAINEDMSNMQARWTLFARHALTDHAQAHLGGGELNKVGGPAQAGRRPGEQDRAFAARQHLMGSGLPGKKAGEAAYAPELLELIGRQSRKLIG